MKTAKSSPPPALEKSYSLIFLTVSAIFTGMGNLEVPRHNPEQLPETAPNFAVLTPYEFLQDFTNEAKRAFAVALDKDLNLSLSPGVRPRMGMEAMYVEFYGNEPKVIFRTLLEAARYGFQTELHLDGFSNVTRDSDLTLIPTGDPDRKRHRMWVARLATGRLQILEESGVEIAKTNPAETYMEKALTGVKGLSEKGFNHRKIYYIDDGKRKVAWIGGMNMARANFLQIDCMVKITDPTIVDALINQFSKVKEDGRSTEISCAEDTSLLADERGDKSIIKEKAVEIVGNAKETVFVLSAFPPSGEFMEALQKAIERGVHITYVTTNPALVKRALSLKTHRLRTSLLDVLQGRENQGIPLLLPKSQVVHGKALVVDEKAAIVGSYNFVGEGNKELSLCSINPTLVKNLVRFFEDIVGEENLRRKFEFNHLFPE